MLPELLIMVSVAIITPIGAHILDKYFFSFEEYGSARFLIGLISTIILITSLLFLIYSPATNFSLFTSILIGYFIGLGISTIRFNSTRNIIKQSD